MGQNRRYGLVSERAHARRAAEREPYRPATPTVRHVWVRLERAAGAPEHAGVVVGWRQQTPAPAANECGWWAQVAYVDEPADLRVAWVPAERLRPLDLDQTGP